MSRLQPAAAESTPTPPAPPAQFNFAAHLLHCNSDRAQKAAYIDDQGTLSYSDLARQVQQMAAALQGAGLQRQQRVLLLMHDCNHWPVSFLGALYAGVLPVAVNTLLTADDYAFMLQHSGAQAVLVSAALLPVLSEALRQSQHKLRHIVVSGEAAAGLALPAMSTGFEAFLNQPAESSLPSAPTLADEPAFWLYSSGSTGRPKGTVHSHANAYWTAELYGKGVLGLREDDICFSAAKLFFAYGLGNALSFPLSVGATTVLMAGRPTPQAVFERWTQQRPTVFCGAPTGFAGMLAAPDLPARDQVALRLVSSAGEALPADLGQRFKAHFGVDIVDGIGSTEMLHIYLSNRPGQVRYGSTGWPVPGYQIELRTEDGSVAAEGQTADLFVQGPSAALMYWDNPSKTAETFVDGWTHTGDKYIRNDDGSYTYSGRSDDMLKVSGVYVSPFEVEATLALHPAVLEAAVIGVLDGEGLTKTKAYVVLKAGESIDEASLQHFVKEHLAPYKYPRSIAFVSDLPKTATGKIQRFKLRQREAGSGP